MKMTPLGSKLLLSQPLRPKQVGLLKIPEAYQDDDMMRVVLAVGPKVKEPIAVGDVAVVGLGHEPKNVEDGTNRVVVDESAIICVIPEVAKSLVS